MFYFTDENLPFRRVRKQRKVLANSATDNTEMITNLASSITDLASIVKGLAQQVTDLTAIVMALQAADGNDDDFEDEDND